MIGYNSRETFQDATYDVQTQQLNSPERSIETHVYRNGKIVATVQCYTSADAPIASIEERMSQQHEEICGKVREGTYELVFLWISRGIIAFESQDYLQALECFESVLAIEETHAEANAYLEKIQTSLKKDADSRRRVLEGYQKQIEALESSGRIMEASRKKAILTRICKAPPPSDKGPARKNRVRRKNPAEGRRPTYITFLENSLESIRGTLLPWIKEELLPAIREGVPRRIREEWIPGIKETLVPRIRDTLLPKIRENLSSKYAARDVFSRPADDPVRPDRGRLPDQAGPCVSFLPGQGIPGGESDLPSTEPLLWGPQAGPGIPGSARRLLADLQQGRGLSKGRRNAEGPGREPGFVSTNLLLPGRGEQVVVASRRGDPVL